MRFRRWLRAVVPLLPWMGGYGALASAGAGYGKQGGSARAVPGGHFDAWAAGNAKFEARKRENLKAMVAIAPWGAQPPNSNWDAQGLAGIRIPSLFVVGDQDDVSGYRQRVRKAFEGAVNSERRLLVYENARHNVGDDTRRAYLDLPVKSAEGSTVWKGFQRRWALGLQMYRYAAGQAAQ